MKISSFVVMDLQIGLAQDRDPKVLHAQFLLDSTSLGKPPPHPDSVLTC